MPAAGDGQRIGLFGGSFNPPHEGHLNLCDLALKRLKLDHIWWMVTPGNPLKDTSQLPSLQKRIELCREIVSDPRIKVTAFEGLPGVTNTNPLNTAAKDFRKCDRIYAFPESFSKASLPTRYDNF